MGFINKYPYTDFHEMNLDSIILEISNIKSKVENFIATTALEFAGVWEIGKSYKSWNIVTYNNDGYVSIKPVPANVDITDSSYWMKISEFNGQVEDVRNELLASIKNFKTLINSQMSAFEILEDTKFNGFKGEVQTIYENYQALFDESQAIQNALISALDSRISQIAHLAAGSTTGDAELIDGRTNFMGMVDTSIGNSIRFITNLIYLLARNASPDANGNYRPNYKIITGKYVSGAHVLENDASYNTVDLLPLLPGQIVDIDCYGTSSRPVISKWSAAGVFVTNINAAPASETRIIKRYINNSNDIEFIRVSYINSKPFSLLYKLPCVEGKYYVSDAYINSSGVKVEQSYQAGGNYIISSPFFVRAGETLRLITHASASTNAISEVNMNGVYIKQIAVGSATKHEFTYTPDHDSYYMVTMNTASNYSLTKSAARNSDIYPDTKSRAIVNFQFDDGNANDGQLVNLFLSKGYKCGFALPTNAGTQLSNYPSRYEHGFDILSHSTDGTPMNDTSATVPEIREKMSASRKTLETYGYNIHGWVTPSSELNPIYQSQLDSIYDYAFTHYWDTSMPGTAYCTLDDDIRELHRCIISNNINDMKDIIDEAVTNKGLLTFYFHGADLTDSYKQVISDMLDYIRTLQDNYLIECFAPDEAIRRYFNL